MTVLTNLWPQKTKHEKHQEKECLRKIHKRYRYFEVMATLMATVEGFSLLPQIIKTIQTKSAEDISKVFLYLLIVINTMWFVKSFILRDWALRISGALYVIMGVTMLVLTYIYGGPTKSTNNKFFSQSGK